MHLRLITDRAELEGTWYVEFLPRRFEGRCWNPDAVYLHMDAVTLFEPLLQRHVPGYDYYAFIETDGAHAHRLAAALRAYADQEEQIAASSELPDRYKMFAWARDEMEQAAAQPPKAFAIMLRDLAAWIERTVPREGVLWILGI